MFLLVVFVYIIVVLDMFGFFVFDVGCEYGCIGMVFVFGEGVWGSLVNLFIFNFVYYSIVCVNLWYFLIVFLFVVKDMDNWDLDFLFSCFGYYDDDGSFVEYWI